MVARMRVVVTLCGGEYFDLGDQLVDAGQEGRLDGRGCRSMSPIKVEHDRWMSVQRAYDMGQYVADDCRFAGLTSSAVDCPRRPIPKFHRRHE
jgi:hypothetical protein